MQETFKNANFASWIGLDCLTKSIFLLQTIFWSSLGIIFLSDWFHLNLGRASDCYGDIWSISIDKPTSQQTQIWGILNQNDNYLVQHTWSPDWNIFIPFEKSSSQNSSTRFIFILSFCDSYIISIIKLSNCFISKNKITAILFLSFLEPELQLCQAEN